MHRVVVLMQITYHPIYMAFINAVAVVAGAAAVVVVSGGSTQFFKVYRKIQI